MVNRNNACHLISVVRNFQTTEARRHDLAALMCLHKAFGCAVTFKFSCKVTNSGDGVMPYHTRSRIAHNFTNALLHFGGIAMILAKFATNFVFHTTTSASTKSSVFIKLFASSAERLATLNSFSTLRTNTTLIMNVIMLIMRMIASAINSNHLRNRTQLSRSFLSCGGGVLFHQKLLTLRRPLRTFYRIRDIRDSCSGKPVTYQNNRLSCTIFRQSLQNCRLIQTIQIAGRLI